MKQPPRKGAGKEYSDAQDKLYSNSPHHNCKNCRILTHWPLCPPCYRWRIHFNATQEAMRAIRAMCEAGPSSSEGWRVNRYGK